MSLKENYRPIIQSGAYTLEWAKRRRVSPDELDPLEIDSDIQGLRRVTKRIVSDLINQNVDICGEDGRVSLPSYAAKRLLPNLSSYGRVIHSLNNVYEQVIQKRKAKGLVVPKTKLFSVGYGPDGYIPGPAETVREVEESVGPQVNAAAQLGYRPIAEATTSLTRLRGAWRAASNAEVPEIDVGIAFDSHGVFAADGTTLEEAIEFRDCNPDRLDTKLVLGANCGSCGGIHKAASACPGELKFGYANSIDIQDIGHFETVNGGNGEEHHQVEGVSVEKFAEVARAHRFPVVSLCCGFCPDDLKKLKALAREGE